MGYKYVCCPSLFGSGELLREEPWLHDTSRAKQCNRCCCLARDGANGLWFHPAGYDVNVSRSRLSMETKNAKHKEDGEKESTKKREYSHASRCRLKPIATCPLLLVMHWREG